MRTFSLAGTCGSIMIPIYMYDTYDILNIYEVPKTFCRTASSRVLYVLVPKRLSIDSHYI